MGKLWVVVTHAPTLSDQSKDLLYRLQYKSHIITFIETDSMPPFSIKDLAKIYECDNKDATYKSALLRGSMKFLQMN